MALSTPKRHVQVLMQLEVPLTTLFSGRPHQPTEVAALAMPGMLWCSASQ